MARALDRTAEGVAVFDASRYEGLAGKVADAALRALKVRDKENAAEQEAMASFVNDAAHQLRTPLAVLSARLDASDTIDVESARRDIAWMGRLVEQLLSMARTTNGSTPFEPVDLNNLCVEVVAALAPLAIMRGRELELKETSSQIMVSGQWGMLFEAISNLTENALSHAPEDSTVTVSVDSSPAVHVLDCGPGVPQDEQMRIFQRFSQGSQPTKGGAGLGLAIVQDIMANHGGGVKYTDRPGGGAVFSLVFSSTAGGKIEDADLHARSTIGTP